MMYEYEIHWNRNRVRVECASAKQAIRETLRVAMSQGWTWPKWWEFWRGLEMWELVASVAAAERIDAEQGNVVISNDQSSPPIVIRSMANKPCNACSRIRKLLTFWKRNDQIPAS